MHRPRCSGCRSGAARAPSREGNGGDAYFFTIGCVTQALRKFS
jgi:hypothetical protein